eukprot:m.698026 g.698026  ORF g.698026 m.698026 type:complete len:72 (+) comp58683_c0_seq29:242-457(+)
MLALSCGYFWFYEQLIAAGAHACRLSNVLRIAARSHSLYDSISILGLGETYDRTKASTFSASLPLATHKAR